MKIILDIPDETKGVVITLLARQSNGEVNMMTRGFGTEKITDGSVFTVELLEECGEK